jgi:hypothetical protein
MLLRAIRLEVLLKTNTVVYGWTTQGNGLVRYSNGEFKRYGRAAGINHLYRAIYIDSLNRIWSASPEEGWFYFQDSIFIFLSMKCRC